MSSLTSKVRNRNPQIQQIHPPLRDPRAALSQKQNNQLKDIDSYDKIMPGKGA